jgi:hypothetical protein
MKKLFLSALMIGAFTASKAQTIDTNVAKPYPVVVLVSPFKVNWNDTAMARFLNVSITSDNLKSEATFHWVLFGAGAVPLQMGDVTCDGRIYSAWKGDNLLPFAFVADKLGLAIK